MNWFPAITDTRHQGDRRSLLDHEVAHRLLDAVPGVRRANSCSPTIISGVGTRLARGSGTRRNAVSIIAIHVTPMPTTEPEPDSQCDRTLVPVALPLLVIVLSAITWVVAVSRSAFWADDFKEVTAYSRSLGDLTDLKINAGKYTANLFWAVATTAFGSGSAIPFLVLNTLIFVTGFALWLRSGLRAKWSYTAAWSIAGAFIASATWLPMALWSSNVVHSAGFLALGLGLFAHQRCVTSETRRQSVSWCVASAAAWTLAVISNILFLGLVSIGAYCAWMQFRRLRVLGLSRLTAAGAFFGNVLLPVLWVAAVAYPATTALAVYAHPGIRYFGADLAYYRLAVAPTWPLAAMYIGVIVVGFVFAVVSLRRRDYFPMAVLCAAGAVAAPVLIQEQQRALNYVAMPILLAFSALAAGVHSGLPTGRYINWARTPAYLVGLVALILIFQQGADVRSFFVDQPYGSSLAVFRAQVAALSPPNSIICAQLNLDSGARSLFLLAISGARGFTISPIGAAGVYFTAVDGACPAVGPSSHIIVSVNERGDFVATRAPY
jgi:hypothetical protein